MKKQEHLRLVGRVPAEAQSVGHSTLLLLLDIYIAMLDYAADLKSL